MTPPDEPIPLAPLMPLVDPLVPTPMEHKPAPTIITCLLPLDYHQDAATCGALPAPAFTPTGVEIAEQPMQGCHLLLSGLLSIPVPYCPLYQIDDHLKALLLMSCSLKEYRSPSLLIGVYQVAGQTSQLIHHLTPHCLWIQAHPKPKKHPWMPPDWRYLLPYISYLPMPL